MNRLPIYHEREHQIVTLKNGAEVLEIYGVKQYGRGPRSYNSTVSGRICRITPRVTLRWDDFSSGAWYVKTSVGYIYLAEGTAEAIRGLRRAGGGGDENLEIVGDDETE